MVDIVKTLGDAPMERETAGTSGRVSVSGVDFSTFGKAALGLVETVVQKRADKAEANMLADMDRYANLAFDPVLAEVDEATAGIAQRLSLMEEQGNLSSSEIARRKQRLLTDFTKKYPGYGDKLAERFNKFQTSLGGLTEEADEEASFVRKQNQDRRASRDKMLTDYGYSPAAMTEAQRDAVFEEKVRAPVERLQTKERRLAELQTANGIYTEEAKLEQREVADTAIEDYQNAVTSRVSNMSALSYEERRTELTQLRTQMSLKFSRLFAGLSQDERQARFGSIMEYIDNELELNENLDPQKVATKEADAIKAKRDTLVAQNQITEEINRGELYKKHGIAKALVARQTLGNLIDNGMMQSDVSILFAPVMSQLTQFVGTAVAQAAPDAQGRAGTPTNLLTGGNYTTSGNFVKSAKEFNKVLSAMHQGPVNETTKDVYSKTLFGALNDTGHGTSMVGIDTMLPQLANPKVVDLLDGPYGEAVAERAEELIPQYAMDLSRRMEEVLGGKAKDISMDIDPKTGMVTLKSSGKSSLSGRNASSSAIPPAAREIQSRINLMIKSYAHLNGTKDYFLASQALFGVEQ